MRGAWYSLLLSALMITVAAVPAFAEEPVVEEAPSGSPDRWSSFLTLGTNVELSKEWSLFAEYAFNFEDLRMLAIGAGYRF